jgi:hypothetical protein
MSPAARTFRDLLVWQKESGVKGVRSKNQPPIECARQSDSTLFFLEKPIKGIAGVALVAR